MATRDILAIGTSAGGVESLSALVRKLPADFPAAILIVIHLPPDFRSNIDLILSKAGRLPAEFARDGQTIAAGHIYLAPPDRHLLLDGDRLVLGRGPRENHTRPAIDPLFRSVGLCCGGRAIGAVLSGMLGDGAAGLLALQQCGGITVVQDPSDAIHDEMPATALRQVKPSHVALLADMPALFQKLLQQPAGPAKTPPDRLKYEVEIAKGGVSSMRTMDRIGRRSVLACPDCHGVMWEIDEDEFVRYRCHVGHAYTAEMMRLALDENLNRALGSALRVLDERIAITKQLRDKALRTGHKSSAGWWDSRIEDVEREAKVIRAAVARIEEIAAAGGKEPESDS